MKSRLEKTIRKGFKKIKRIILKDIPAHPVAGKRKIKSIGRYLNNHLGFANKPLIVDWFNGIKYYYQKGDASFSDNYFFGLAEWQESLFLMRYLSSLDLLLDVGANHGHYTLLASAYSQCNVYAVEPVPATFQQLQKNIALNHLEKKVTLLNIGLSSNVSSLYFSTDKGTMNKIVGENYNNKVAVEVETLDSLNLKPTVIKIDVEGFEYDVFTGGQNTLDYEGLNIVICEINFTLKEGVSGMDIVNFMKQRNFFPYSFDGKKMIRLDDYNHNTFNTIFVKDIALVEARFKAAKQIQIWGVSL